MVELYAQTPVRKQSPFLDFERLFNEYYDKVYTYIVCRVHNQSDAEDLTADVFLKAFNKPYNLQLAGFSTYIFIIAANTVKDHYRARARYAAVFTAGEPDENLGDGADLLGTLISREENAALERALAALPERQYEAVYRRYYLEQGLRKSERRWVLARMLRANCTNARLSH